MPALFFLASQFESLRGFEVRANQIFQPILPALGPLQRVLVAPMGQEERDIVWQTFLPIDGDDDQVIDVSELLIVK